MKENILLYTVVIVQVTAVLLQLGLYVHYKKLAKESVKLQSTTNETLKQMKLKYENYRKLDVFIPNVDTFIGRYMDSEKIFYIEVAVMWKFIYVMQFVVAVLGVWQALYNLRYGIIVGFTMLMFYYISKLWDYIRAKNQAIANIREFFAKSDHGRLKEKREDKQHRETMLENVSEDDRGEDKATKDGEMKQESIESPSEDISITEAAIYDMLSEIFDL